MGHRRTYPRKGIPALAIRQAKVGQNDVDLVVALEVIDAGGQPVDAFEVEGGGSRFAQHFLNQAGVTWIVLDQQDAD